MVRHAFIAICGCLIAAAPSSTSAYDQGPYVYHGDLPFEAYLEQSPEALSAGPDFALVASAAPRNRWPSPRVFFVAVSTASDGSLALPAFRFSYLVHLVDDPGGVIICG